MSTFSVLGTGLASGGEEKYKTMRPLPILLTLSILCFTNAVMAVGSGENANKIEILRVERVGPEVLGLTAAAGTDPYVRVVARSGNGRYLVAVHSNVGILRMQGAYLDSTLSVEDGIFTYYHPNGLLECKGCFVAGVKTGTWLRYGLEGEQLSERVYGGRSAEEITSGIAVVGGVRPADRPALANRRQSQAMEF